MGQRRSNLREMDERGERGDWCFYNEDTSMFIRYGDRMEDTVHVYIDPAAGKIPCWTWDGNREAPTLWPSIRVHYHEPSGQEVELWHGWMRAGELVAA